MIREERQLEAADAYLNSDRVSIINACPRFGKIKVAIDILRRGGYKNPLFLAPRLDIWSSWVSDFKKWRYDGDFEFHAFPSIKNLEPKSNDIIILDEAHEMSVNQQQKLRDRIPPGMHLLALTGTITQKTGNELYDNLNLDVCYKYTIEQGVDEGILTDYQLHIHKVPLFSEEGKKFSKYLYVRNLEETQNKMFFDLKLINIIQNSEAKYFKTKWLTDNAQGRVLIFCGTTAIADRFNIPVYHSKKKEEKIFLDFCNGIGDKLVTIKMMQAGVTVNPINTGIINYMSGNPEDGAQKICRFLGFEYQNPDKKANIHIICTTEPFELGRLKTGLQFFNDKKINYVSNN